MLLVRSYISLHEELHKHLKVFLINCVNNAKSENVHCFFVFSDYILRYKLLSTFSLIH